MKRLLSLLASIVPLGLIVLLCGFGTAHTGVPDVPVIVTAAPAYQPLAALQGKERFPQGSHLLILQNGDAEPLLPDFAASADASVSFDGKSVLFAGKKAAADPWQIFELTLDTHEVRGVIAGVTDAIRPLYMPGRRLVFAQRTEAGHYALKTAGLDGRDTLALTYLPADILPADAIADGRILFEAGFPLGSGSTPEMFLVYADGSGVESYRCDHGSRRWGGRQLASGDIVFTHGNSLARFTSPLASEARIAAPAGDYAGAIAETRDGHWLLSVRPTPAARFALKAWNPASPAALPQTVLARPGENLVEPVLVEPRDRPKQHPSGLHDWSYGNLLALDARASREGDLKTVPASVRLETQDAAGRPVLLGTSAVESDGSFFVKAPGDRPLRFTLLDPKGVPIRQEHGWFWVRKGEQRICVGCHTGPERASENNVPAVLLRSTTPADLSNIPTSNTAHTTTQGSR